MKKHKNSEMCLKCHLQDKVHKNNKNTTNMIKCCDCENLISKKSKRCRLCHYALIKSKSKIHNKEYTKGHCIDCNISVDIRATRCLSCSKK